jgi:hypothetical protein
MLLLAILISTALADTLNWSDPATWGGVKPAAGAVVTIPENTVIRLDEPTPSFSGLNVDGVLVFDRQDLTLTAGWIMIHGRLEIGTPARPFTHRARLVLNATNPSESVMGMGTRGILVMDGQLELHGTPPEVAWTKLDDHGLLGATSLTVADAVDWQAGDQVAIGPTDYFEAGNGASITQRVTLTSVSGRNVGLSAGLNAHRWGLLQYATPAGMSLSPDNRVTPPQADTDTTSTPTVLDQRAPVGNLTRNIVIEAPDDALWRNDGFGVHIMVMRGAEARLDGVEIRRGGQRGRLARYPFHWHILSYSGAQTLSDASGQYVRNSVVNESANRGLVIHGTNGAELTNNILYRIRGHGIFTEDAVERRNLIQRNLVLHVRNQLPQHALKLHETGERGASCFWISNPDNTVTGNHAADCWTNGFWLPFPRNPWGDHRDVPMNPSRLLFGVFDGNTAHSNGMEGIMIDFVEVDNEGDIFPHQYASTTDGQDPVWPLTTLKRFTLARYSVWKNGGNGIWDRARNATNIEAVSADNAGRYFAGAGDGGLITRSLVVGTSLNHQLNGTGRPTFADFSGTTGSPDPVAFATYHSTFDLTHNIVIGFPAVAGRRSGVFATDDYYIRPVEKGQFRNVGNLIIDSHAGVKLRSPFPYFTLASALWDPHGVWGPPGNFIVYDEPFLTHGKDITVIPPADVSGGVSVPGPFYGFEGFILYGEGFEPPKNPAFFDLWGLHVRRLDDQMNEVATWSVPGATEDLILQHMRDFATAPESIYELTFPEEEDHPTDFHVTVENMTSEDDTQVIGIQFDGGFEADVWIQSFQHLHVYEERTSLEEVIASAGETYWQDHAGNRVWVKLRGGRWRYWTEDPNEDLPSYDDLLYEPVQLRMRIAEPVSIDETDALPATFALSPAYPNPFNPSTAIGFQLPVFGQVRLSVHDALGREVAVLADGVMPAGRHSVTWDARNQASGVYLVRMSAAGGSFVRKVVLVK